MTGWTCPRCLRCYAPHVDECMACRPVDVYLPLTRPSVQPFTYPGPGTLTGDPLPAQVTTWCHPTCSS